MAAAVLFFVLLLSLSPLAFSGPPSSDSASLLLLKESFKITDNDPLKDWSPSSTSPPCLWTGVICMGGIVTGLRLANLNLSGTINVDALSHFQALRSISFNNNNLFGAIPILSPLQGLKSIYLSRNKFSGPIPNDFFTEMDHLKKLWLDGNSFSGPIPNSLAKAASLMELYLDRNNFTGEIPDLNIKPLKYFNISNNPGITGAIPSNLAKFGPDSFEGNPNLCGPPLTPCGATPLSKSPDDKAPPDVVPEENDGNSTTFAVVIVLILTMMIVFALTAAKKRQHEVAPFDDMSDQDATEAMEAAAAAEAVVEPIQKPGGLAQKQNGATRAGGGPMKAAGDLVMVNEEKGVFGMSDMMKAAAEVLGNGALGSAYKAVMANGVTVAVKRMREMNRVGKDVFDAEMRKFGKLRHRNVLCPLAYHYRKEEKLVVSQFMKRGSLLYLLHGDRGSDHAALDWPTRRKIIRGVVRGVAYLHAELTSLDVPHGNLKSGNILLAEDYEPVVADYGFIGLVNPSQAPNVLFAYKSPEAVLHHTVCPKSDVYCLGIIILEILTGKFPSQYLNNTKGGTEVVHWTKSAIAENREAELLDPAMSGSDRESVEDMVKLLKVGVACADADPEVRPDMKEVVAMVEEIAPDSPSGPTISTSAFKEAYNNGESSSSTESPRIERTASMEIRGSQKRNGTYVMLPSNSFK